MVYQANSMKLKMLSVILTSEKNDVLLCKRISDGKTDSTDGRNRYCLEQYLLWVLKDRKVIRYLLQAENELSWIDCFPYGESLCLVMPYKEHRSLLKFWKSEVKGKEEKKELCRELITLCMTARLPAPILFLLLSQRQLGIHKDGKVYFSYELDFSGLDERLTEGDCILALIRLLQELSDPEDKEEQRMSELMEKKFSRRHYESFLDLYLDWKRPAARKWGWGISEKAKVRFFYFLVVLAVILLLLLIIIVVSQIVFGDVPLFRLFMDTFHKIGSEILGR